MRDVKLHTSVLRRLIREAMQTDYTDLRSAISRLKTMSGFDIWSAVDMLSVVPDSELDVMFGQPEVEQLAGTLEKLTVMLSELEYILADSGVVEPVTY